VDNKLRFSNRVDNYVRYRPGYPAAALDFLYSEIGLSGASIVADVGAGTGIFTRLLLERGTEVYAVEPNREMRLAAESVLSSCKVFHSVDGSAEETTLSDGSMDFVVSAQAFHWFDIPATKKEFERILKPSGQAVLIWNRRLSDTGRFASEYELLLRTYGRDYATVNHTNLGKEQFSAFFLEGEYRLRSFDYQQIFDWEGLKGRLLSSSYCPLPGEEAYEALLMALQSLFTEAQKDGTIAFDYSTDVYYGQV
jgi:SAM-dependent methyltransferase